MNSLIGRVVEEGDIDTKWWSYMANGQIWPRHRHRSEKEWYLEWGW